MAGPDKRGRRTWRFRLNDTSVLEVSTPPRATEKQVRRRGRVSLVLGAVVATLLVASVAFADTITTTNAIDTSTTPDTDTGTNSDTKAPGGSGTIYVYLNPSDNATDPQNGCNATGSSPATLSVTSSDISKVTIASPGAVTVNGCGPDNAASIGYSVLAGASGSVTVTVAYSSGGRGGIYVSGTFTVNITSANNPPVVDADTTDAGYSGNEGSAIALDRASATDSDGPGPLSYLWTIEGTPSVDGGSCSLSNATSLTAATIACTDNGTATVKLTATESGVGGKSGSDTASVTINNANPVISSASFGTGSPPHVSCGTNNASLTVSFTDAGSNDTHDGDVDWDGATPPVYDQNVDPFTSGSSIPHTYGAAGSHTAKVKVTDDDDGESNVASATVVVDFNTSGILQPVNDTRNGQLMSVFKYKSTIPVKIKITDCDGSVVSSLTPIVSFKKLSGEPPTEGLDEAASTVPPTDGVTMRWDSGAQQYIYNLATKQLGTDSSASYRITVTIQAGQTVWADIGVKP